MKTVVCTKCAATHEVETLQHTEVRRDAPGWNGCWDVSNGLTFVWYCVECSKQLRAAVDALQEALGPLEIRYANLLPFYSKEES